MDSNTPFFSIVIPAYNRADFIGKTLTSVLAQQYQNFEIIVVDDGSTDNTEEVVRSFSDPRIVYMRKNNGERAAARNFGVAHAKGEWVTFLDSDDLFKNNHLSEALTFLRHNPQAEIFSLGYDVVLPDGTVQRAWKPLPNPVNDKLAEGNFLSCLGVFVKRNILLQYPFNEDRELSGSEDYELWLRLAARYPIYTCPQSTASLVNHESRSVVGFSTTKLLKRRSLLKKYVMADKAFALYYGAKLKMINAYFDLYSALHLVMAGERKQGIKYLYQAWIQYPFIMLNYRFWVVIKKLIF